LLPVTVAIAFFTGTPKPLMKYPPNVVRTWRKL
jgi:hypothetical protein